MRFPALVAARAEAPLLLVPKAHARALIAVLLVLAATPAFADVTLFIGSTTTPANRAVKGAAVGISLVIVGFEFEYADTGDDELEAAPSLRTGMGNVLVQTPIPIAGIQFYATMGAGGYREQLGEEPNRLRETHVGINTGGGVKVSLIGPVRARLDYRLFKLRGEPLHSTVHRVYAGFNLGF
jgi:hypothetical protein